MGKNIFGFHFADTLTRRCVEVGAATCVGLDPVLDRLPTISGGAPQTSPAQRIELFCRGVIDAAAEHAACVKPQLACFERWGAEGWRAYEAVVRHARESGLPVIADAKRGDIGVTSGHYAAGLLEGDAAADAVTLSPYLGMEALSPFLEAAQQHGKGLFLLVRTSNPGAGAVQSLTLDDGRTVAEAVADQVAAVGEASVGESGYANIGAVVAATTPDDAAALRQRMPKQIFLVPGFGAQGGDAASVRPCFDAYGRGAVVNASRSVIYAFEGQAGQWKDAVRDAAARFADDLRCAAG